MVASKKTIFAKLILTSLGPLFILFGTFVLSNKYFVAFAQCGGVNEQCCFNGGPSICLTAADLPMCTCPGAPGISCALNSNNLPYCTRCTEEGDTCCYNPDIAGAFKYECQGGAVYCPDSGVGTPVCALNPTDQPCDAVNDVCCKDGAGANSYYCDNSKIVDLTCIAATGLCGNDPGATCIQDQPCWCDQVNDPCCSDITGDFCMNSLKCLPNNLGQLVCQAQGICGQNYMDQCCTTGEPCASPLVCFNSSCIYANEVPSNFTGPAGSQYTGPIISDLAGLLAPIFKILFYAGVFIGILGIIYSGYLLIASEGDPGRVKEGKDQLTAAILGTLFVLLSVLILRVIINNILGVTNSDL